MKLVLLVLLSVDAGLDAYVEPPPLSLPRWGSSLADVKVMYPLLVRAQSAEGFLPGTFEQPVRFSAYGVRFNSVLFRFENDRLAEVEFSYRRIDHRASARNTFEAVEHELDQKYGKIETGGGKCRTVRRDSNGIIIHVLSTLLYLPPDSAKRLSGITDAACGW